MRDVHDSGAGVTGTAEQAEDRAQKEGRRASGARAALKAVILLALVAVTTYGMLDNGLYETDLWAPVAAGILGLLVVTLVVPGYYEDVHRVGLILVALLAALVAVKGFSITWTISETETVRELLRSAMYLAAFVLALASLSRWRQVIPLLDAAVLMAAAVAGYGLMQKISPIEYPVLSLDGVRVDSTLDYSNTTAVILGMGATLGLARLTQAKNAVFRGAYAALLLALLVALYLTLSRGGIASLGMGAVVLFVLANNRLQMLANALLVSVPLAWLLWRMQNLEGLLRAGVSDQQKIEAGAAFRTDLILALAVALVLQVGYALVANRYGLSPPVRRAAGIFVAVGVVLALCAVAGVTASRYGGVGEAYDTLLSNPVSTEDAGQRLASLSIGKRTEYWAVAWEEWKEYPLTGTGAGTFQFTWLQERDDFSGVKQVHNLYLEQGTETGVFAFLALAGFAALLLGHAARGAWRADPAGDRRLLLAGLVAALTIYLISSFIEWHWYIPASTLFFFVLAAVAAKLASEKAWDPPEADVRPADGEPR